MPAAVRHETGQGPGSRFLGALSGQGAAARTRCVPPRRVRQDSSGLTEMTLFFKPISGSRIRLAHGAGCQPQFGTKLAKGRVVGLYVSFVANSVYNMALCCCTAAFTAYIRSRVDSHYFSFWLQKFSPARGSVPTTVRRASGQGPGVGSLCVLRGQGAVARTHDVLAWRVRQTISVGKTIFKL